MSERTQYKPKLTDPDTGRVINWTKTKTFGSEVEPNNFAPKDDLNDPAFRERTNHKFEQPNPHDLRTSTHTSRTHPED
ncbi:hypothetical protein A2382_02750 [Candidatus Woesebacteria bacterium RIFOXYB1_FULL_38_16]|uniref:Uncharacterized protein n=1 Tax=Candidatus Woesebacteria bacterium RIFOXYB1_FULL_38_16 TaxID=1802538 RepID=A0A1F8CS61_9BACT|nr:MAG: hypothetical protein A2191_03785 [Candidatus Woesebacteria bacterium RIFOXYA1_FULL_38_9]OGM79130.1 MAG: hypothetical protein A2382_02750 [Candidatus Woesebacteria bacterium RIFOXYB1_FULL_38_16]